MVGAAIYLEVFYFHPESKVGIAIPKVEINWQVDGLVLIVSRYIDTIQDIQIMERRQELPYSTSKLCGTMPLLKTKPGQTDEIVLAIAEHQEVQYLLRRPNQPKTAVKKAHW